MNSIAVLLRLYFHLFFFYFFIGFIYCLGTYKRIIRVRIYKQICVLFYVKDKAEEERESAAHQGYKMYKDQMEEVSAVQFIYILFKK